MAVDVFDEVRFSQALADALTGTGLEAIATGYSGGELHYVIPVKTMDAGFGNDVGVGIKINSSIRKDGQSAGSGQDSIRVWIADHDQYPLGNKTQRWVTRVPGWEKRLAKVLQATITMAQAINICPTCGALEKVFVVKKDGPNKGRYFKKCDGGCSFVWLDEVDEDTPPCPSCGHEMVKRNGKYGEFWGCRQFPKCRGTRKIDDDSWREEEEPVGYWQRITKEHVDAKNQEMSEEEIDAIMSAPSTGPKTEEEMDELAAEVQVDRQKAKASLLDKLNRVVTIPDKPKEFTPSDDQKAIFQWVTEEQGQNLVVEAVAGSGKTTTGVKMLEMIPTDKRILFVAFNRHIAKELAKRAPRHVRVTTYHSLGYKAIRQAYGNVKVDDKKVNSILEQYFDKKVHGHLFAPTRQLVSLVKANLTGTSDEELFQLIDYHGIALNGEHDVVFNAVSYVMARATDMTNVVDFDDMCYLPVYHKLQMEKYDVIFIDEAQDTNRNQIQLAMACCHEDTRVIAVGDRYQSLYGFRGADVDAIPNLIESLKAETLPLSISYRAPKSITQLVNQRFPHIDFKSAEWAIDGEVIHESYNQALVGMESGDMVLCRNNAPLVRPAFALIRDGKKAVIRGRDIGKGLISLIRKMDAYDVNEMLRLLSEYESKEVSKLLNANKTNQAQTVQDKVDTIVAISDGCDYVHEVERKIEMVFSDEVEGTVFSTVHKAKGLEAETVFILNPELMPSRHATQPWELQQEDNIMYVAYTRALVQLIFVRE